eukprot:188238_1
MTSTSSERKPAEISASVSILFILLYLSNLGISISILLELYRHGLSSLFITSLSIFSIPYLFLFFCLEYDSFVAKPDIVKPNPTLPFYRLLSLADYWYPLSIDYSLLNNRCIEFFYDRNHDTIIIQILNICITSFLFLIMSLLVPIAWLNLILLNKSIEGYSVAVCLDVIIIINMLNHVIIIANIDRSNEYILNAAINACIIGIVFTFMTAFNTSYHRIFKYNNSTSLPALCFCIEFSLLFIMLMITFIAQYDVETSYFEWIFTLIAFVNCIYPNVPFHKTFLMYSFVKWSTSEIYGFVIKHSNNSLEDMCVRLYCYLHREIQHQENVNGHCVDAHCWQMHFEFMELNNTEKLKSIYKLMNHGQNWKCIEKRQAQKRFMYFLSSVVALVFPFWWFHLTMGTFEYVYVEHLFYALNAVYVLFVMWVFVYLIWKVKWTFIKLKIMMLIFSQREKAEYTVAKYYLHAMYGNMPAFQCIYGTIQYVTNKDIAFIILSYLMTVR